MSADSDGASSGGVRRRLRGWLGLGRRSDPVQELQETLAGIIEEREDSETPLDEQERRLLANVLRLRDVTAHDVMVPRADIIAVEAGIGLEELIEVIGRHPYSRFPVYRGTLDDAVGIVEIRDVLTRRAAGQPFALSRILRRALFASPWARVLDLLLEMRVKRIPMALVVDEYGGIDGLVTEADLVEQIVGEIEGERDATAAPDFTPRPDGSVEADARVPLAEFEERYHLQLADDEETDIDTLGGLVSSLVGRVPDRGELIAHPSGLEFEVVDADPRRIKRLRIRNLSPAPDKTS